MDILRYNRQAWDRQVDAKNPWTVPVTDDAVEAARAGQWSIVLTPTKPVPRSWFPELSGARALCLASGGGQQAPILAAAGARVVSFDLSPRQLAQDRLVARRHGLPVATLCGDMRDLGALRDRIFDLVVLPVANCFVPDVRPVWREAARVLAPGGVLLAGSINPAAFVFDDQDAHAGRVTVRHRLPYADAQSLPPEELDALREQGEPFVFSHSLEDLIGGQLEAGLRLTHLLEDTWPERAFSRYLPTMIASRSVR